MASRGLILAPSVEYRGPSVQKVRQTASARNGADVETVVPEDLLGFESDDSASASSSDCYESDTRSLQEMEPEEEIHPGKTYFKLDSDIHNVVLVSYLLISGKRTLSLFDRVSRMAWPICLSLICAGLQMLMSVLVLSYVRTQAMPVLNTEVDIAIYEMAYGDVQLTAEVSEAICGPYDHVHIKANQPAANIPYPDGTKMQGDKSFWAKLPDWRWDAKWLGLTDGRGLMDTLRVVASEGFFDFHQGYALLFLLTNFLWLCSIFVELRSVTRMALMLLGVNNESDAECAIQAKGAKFVLNHIAWDGKAWGFGVVLTRYTLALLLGIAGVEFLRYTNYEVDLILNSLALIFIFELDVIFFKTMLPHSQQLLMDNLKSIGYKSVLPPPLLKRMKYFLPVLGFLMICSATFWTRKLQLDRYVAAFENAALLCLFAGPAPDNKTLVPVPGMCESLLKLSCTESPDLQGQNSPCVVTSYDWPWAVDPNEPKENSAFIESAFAYPPGSGTPNVFDLELQHAHPVARKFRLVDGVNHRFTDRGVQDNFRWMEATLQRACYGMYHRGQRARRLDWGGDVVYVAPFSCPKDLGLWELFTSFKYQWHRSPIVKSWVDMTPSHLKITEQDEKLGQMLAACGR